ncbi:MAG: endonuclease domain-containing protein, partial [Acidimicrobiia bacterium]
MKRCTKCGGTKPASDFYAAKGCVDGLRGDCKSCHAARAKAWYAANRERAIANTRRWQQDNAEPLRAYRREHNATRTKQIREGHLRRTFGMTLADYEAMLAAQGGGCAICGMRPKTGESFHVDHLGDEVRGILCVRCNNALGQLREAAGLAEVAVDYLASGGFAPTGVYELRRRIVDRAR